MKLVIGGYAQGKLQYVLQKYGLKESAVANGKLPKETQSETIVVYRFHEWFRQSIEKKEDTEGIVREFLKTNEDCILISDEIFGGIIPIDRLERKYRQRLGRMLVEIAQTAEEVERVICGIGQKIK